MAVPPGVVTVTVTRPARLALVTALIFVALVTWKLAAVFVPKCTAVAPVNPVPMMITVVPPAAGRLSG